MGVVDQKQELLENIQRLRHAARDVPDNEDISIVRAALERQLGPTVSRRLAARLLGVSHTALDRWINKGDIPLVYSPAGRREVPVPSLLELRDAVDAQRGVRSRYVLAPTMARQHEAADHLDLPEFERVGARHGHAHARDRSLAYHRALAQQLRNSVVDEARYVLSRWRQEGRIDVPYADKWERLLAGPLSELQRALVDETHEGDDLRQNSPFAGLLSEPERLRILREVV